MKRICEYCGKEYEWEENQPNWGKGNIPTKKPQSVSAKHFCCYECGQAKRQEKRKQTNLERFGCENVSNNKNTQDKRNKTLLERYGVNSYAKTKEFKEKTKQDWINKYGVDNPNKLCAIKEKIKKTNLERHGVEYVLQLDSVRDKSKQTKIKQHNDENYNNRTKAKQTNLERFGCENPSGNKNIRQVIKSTCLEKYGVDNYTKSEAYKKQLPVQQQKEYQTKKKNNSFNTSKSEEIIYQKLKTKYKDVKRQYKSELYPYCCDFYILEKNLYIEYQGSWTHGGEPYDENNKECQEKLKLWKSKSSKYYKNAIEVWIKRDMQKREIAKKNKLNWIEFFNMNDFDKWINKNKTLQLNMTEKAIQKEYDKINTTPPGYDTLNLWNKIVLCFQWQEFYKTEIQMWNENKNDLQKKLIANRCKYLFKDEEKLTSFEILRGFKISGKHVGNSHHSPFWIKKFIEDYGVDSIYDCCGGWGHRLVGVGKDFKYIYNDINKTTHDNCKKIADYFSMTNKTFYNQDASLLTPEENYEAVFTCPPYWNTEMYSDDGAENLSYEDFLLWWKQVVTTSTNKPNVKFFAFIINNKFQQDMKNIVLECGLELDKIIKLGKDNNLNHFQRSSVNIKKGESLLVFKV